MRKSVLMSAATACAAFLVSVLLITSTSVGAPQAAVEPTAARTDYTVTDLGTLGGASIARGVNTSGQVVGQSQIPPQPPIPAVQNNRAFLWENGTMTNLGTLVEKLPSFARSIDNDGRVVGFSRISSTNTQLVRAFLWEEGQMKTLPTLDEFSSSEASYINDAGVAVGRAFNSSSQGRAVLWENGQDSAPKDLGESLKTPYSEAWGINDLGQVVGESGTGEESGQAFLYTPGNGTKSLGILPDQLYSEAFGIDNSGQIVGWSYTSRLPVRGRAFLYKNGEMKDLGTLEGDLYSMARAIDEHGRVVGQSRDVNDQNRAFLWENDKMTDLNSLVTDFDPPLSADSPLKLLDAYAISDSGKIVGSALNKAGQVRAFLLTPNDATAPNTTATTSPDPSAGWFGEDVTVSLEATDEGGSNVKAITYSLNGDQHEPVPGKRATFDITTEGETTITYSAKDHADNTEEPKTLTVRLDRTRPKIACGAADGLWHKEDVSLPCTASDDGAGLADPADASFTLTTSVPAGTETNDARSDSREVCDAAGNCATAGPISGNKVDKKAPDTAASSGSYNEGDWTNQSVTVTLDASDGGSGIQGTEYDLDDAGYLPYQAGGVPVSGEGRHTIIYRSTDKVGNVESPAESFSVNIDNTSPELTGSRNPAPNANGWNNTDVTVHFTCADALSGLASGCPVDVVLGEGASQSVSRGVSDRAGNSASATVSDINVDKTAPTVDVTGVTAGATYLVGSVPAAGCSTTDGLSGVDRQATLNVTGGPLGSITATCSGASDRAGNPGSASVTYSVVYDFGGFFSPVDYPDVLNRAKAGSAIPVKFSLGGDHGLDIFATAADRPSFPKSGAIACDSTEPIDPIEQTVTANSSGLTYDASTDRYTYVWKTNREWTGCRQLVVELDDGKDYRANFKFTR